MTSKLTCKLTHIDFIYHISDIHIRLRQRHDEYKQVFDELFKVLTDRNAKNKNGIVVITGDILHSKTHLSPEVVELTHYFFHNVSKIMPTIVIAGNHDANLSNLTRLDALSPIIDPIQKLKKHQLYYLRYSGIYTLCNISFGVTSVFGSSEPSVFKKITQASDITTSSDTELKIALCHETLHNSTTHSGYSLTNTITVKDFVGYDFVLLGDIHKRQFMNKKQTIGYAGSLIQQDKGESISEHGLIEWDLAKRNGTFVNIKNLYGFYKMTYKNNTFEYNDEDEHGHMIHEKVRLFIEHDDTITDPDLRKKIRKRLQKQGKEVKSIALTKLASASDHDESMALQEEHCDFNIGDVNKQNYYIELYMKSGKNKYSESEIKEIQEFNRDINKQKAIADVMNVHNWELESLTFSNLFSYGADNNVTFSAMRGVLGFIGPNHIGKSSIIDIILYMLFDTCSRCSSTLVVANEILNNTRNSFDSSLVFRILDKRYCIRKHGVKGEVKSNSVKVNVQFWELLPDGNKLDLKGLNRGDTKKIIESYIGKYDDFLITSVALQNNLKYEFIEQTTGNRVDILNSLLCIDIFDTLRKIVTRKIDELNVLLKHTEDSSDNISVLKSKRSDIEREMIGLKRKQTTVQENIKDVQQKMDTLHKKSKEVKTVSTVSELTTEKQRISQIISDVTMGIKISDAERARIIQEHRDMCDTKEEKERLIESLKSQLKTNTNTNKVFGSSTPNVKGSIPQSIEKKRGKLEIKRKNLLLQKSKQEKYNAKYESYSKYTLNTFIAMGKQRVTNQALCEKIALLEERLKTQQKHEYDPKCKYCLNSTFVRNAHSTKESLDILYQTRGDICMKEEEENYMNYKKMLDKKDVLKQKLETVKDSIRDTTDAIHTYKQTIVELEHYKEYMDVIEHNKGIQCEISNLIACITTTMHESEEYGILMKSAKDTETSELQLQNYRYQLENVEQDLSKWEIARKNEEYTRELVEHKEMFDAFHRDLHMIMNQYNKLQLQHGTIDASIVEYEKNEKNNRNHRKRIALYEKYTDIMQKNSLPYFMISKVIPTLERRINTILRRTVDFTIKFELEQKKRQKYINIYIQRDDKECSIHMCSGFEKFVSNIVVKIGIRSIAKIPKPNFMIIDEGFGNFDEEHLNTTISNLFQYLNGTFDYTLLISHIDVLKDYINTHIHITRDNGYSRISY